MSLNEIMQLAFTVSGIPLKNVQNVVLPGSAHTVGSLSVVTLDDAWKTRIFNDVKPDGILTKAQAEVDATKRADLYNQAEDYLLNTQMAALPLNWYNGDQVYANLILHAVGLPAIP